MTTLEHRCRSNDRCASRTPDGAAITSKPDTLCNGCAKKLQGQLEQLPALREALRAFLGSSPVTTHGSRVHSTPEPSAPINLRALDLMDELEDVVFRVGGPKVRVADLIRRPAEKFVVWRGGRPRDTYLDGVDRALAVGKAWRKADQVIGLSRTWERRAAPCPRCGLPTLGGWAGESTIHCTNSSCGTAFTRLEYENLCIANANRRSK
jgi:hypothetical protein